MFSETELAYMRQLDKILAAINDDVNCKLKYIDILSCPSKAANDARILCDDNLEKVKGLLAEGRNLLLEMYLGKGKDNSNSNGNDNDNGGPEMN